MTDKQTEALKLALEALENSRSLEPVDVQWVKGKRHAAIIAIREALAEQLAKQHVEHCLWARNGHTPCPHVQPHKQQEPVALTGKQRIYLAQAWAMLDDYALDQRSKGNDSFADGAEASSHEIKMMLSSPPAQQEPFGYIAGVPEWGIRQSEITVKITRNAQPQYGFVNAVYTSPPASKPWVGLTPEDIAAAPDNLIALVAYIEAKLKEKNHG